MTSQLTRILTAAAFVATVAVSNAQYAFTSVSQTITESFTNYSGSSAPTNWTLVSVNRAGGGGAASFQGNLGSSSNNTGGWRSYGATTPSNSTDRSLGFLGNGNFGGGNGNGTAANNELNLATMTANFTNSTLAVLTELVIGYTGEQWLAQSSRASLITVSYSTNGVDFTAIPSLTFNALNTTAANNTVLDGDLAGNRTVFSPVSITGLAINPAQNFQVRWSYNGGAGSGSRQGLSIDDVSVQAIPEPSTIALWAGLGAFAVLVGARAARRRS